MAKVALLIGVSEYELGLNPLPGAVKDAEAIQRVLQHPEMGEFAEADVTLLRNPDRQKMEESIEQLFSGRQKDDLVLLFFSGHGIRDETGKLYLASRQTRKNSKGELIRASAVPATVVHDNMERTRSKRKVVILDCCFSGAFAEGLSAKDDGSVDIKSQLGGEGRAILTSSTSTQYSFEQQGSDLSIYTRYLVEGIETGEADENKDGVISVNELHDYAAKRVQEVQPTMKPKIYWNGEGAPVRLAQALGSDPRLQYRREVQKHADHGEISNIALETLDALRNTLNLSLREASVIESEVLSLVHERQRSLRRYEQHFREAIQRGYPISQKTRGELKSFQRFSNLEDRDVEQVEAQIIAQRTAAQSQTDLIKIEDISLQQTTISPQPLTSIQPFIFLSSLTATLHTNRFLKIVGFVAALLTLTGIVALIYGHSNQSRRLLLQQSETLKNQGGYSSAFASWLSKWAQDNVLLQEIEHVLQVADDLPGAKERKQKMTFDVLKQQAQLWISQREEAVGSTFFLKIEEILQVADDVPGAEEIEKKITHAEWKRKAQVLISDKKAAINAFETQRIQELEQRTRELEQTQKEAEITKQRQPEPTPEPLPTIKPSTSEPPLTVGSKRYSYCYEVTGSGVKIRSDDDFTDNLIGDAVTTVEAGTLVGSTGDLQNAQISGEQETRNWLRITDPTEGWIASEYLIQIACK